MSGPGMAFILGAIMAVQVCGQSVPPAKAEVPKAPLHFTNLQPIRAAPFAEELTLTGIIDLSSYQRAFLKIEAPGQPARYQTLTPGAPSGEVTLLTIDSHKNKVTVRHRGNVRELWLNTRTSGRTAPSTHELERDASHSAYHTRRAQLDREREDGEEAQPK